MHIFRLLLAFLSLTPAFAGEIPTEVKFMAYNLQNYLRMDRALPGKGNLTDAPKPEEEIQALISIIQEEKPDILGVCEMGTPTDFQDFQTRLKAVGLDYPYTEFVQALDPERHLALVSKYPISAKNPQTNLSFELSGKKQYFKRGILDVTIDVTPSYQLRLLGTHLKSKREVPEDQALIRRSEAHLLRLHAKSILEKSPDTKLLVYGDLNDTINEAPIREIMGKKGADDYLKPVWLEDRNGEKWTHYWKVADIYARIDYILVSPKLSSDLINSKNHIPYPPNWSASSDHRPLVVVLRIAP